MGSGSHPQKERVSQVILEVIDRALTRTPAQFEPAQPVVARRGSAQVQLSTASGGEILDAFPHHQIVSAELERPFVRSPELVDRLLPELKKDAARDAPRAGLSKHNNAAPPSQDVLLHVLEEPKRLWRQPMFATRPAVQRVELPDSPRIIQKLNPEPLSFGLAHSAPHRGG